jgi:hypothetical protein
MQFEARDEPDRVCEVRSKMLPQRSLKVQLF